MVWNETKGNLFMGFVLLIFSIAMIIGARNFEKSQFLELGPDLFPIIIGSMIAGLSLILIIISALKLRSAGAADTNSEKPIIYTGIKRVLIAIALLAGYVIMIVPIGFVISSSAYMLAKMCFLAEKLTRRKVIIYAIMSILVAFIANFIFVRFFWLMLPRGIFGF